MCDLSCLYASRKAATLLVQSTSTGYEAQRRLRDSAQVCLDSSTCLFERKGQGMHVNACRQLLPAFNCHSLPTACRVCISDFIIAIIVVAYGSQVEPSGSWPTFLRSSIYLVICSAACLMACTSWRVHWSFGCYLCGNVMLLALIPEPVVDLILDLLQHRSGEHLLSRLFICVFCLGIRLSLLFRLLNRAMDAMPVSTAR